MRKYEQEGAGDTVAAFENTVIAVVTITCNCGHAVKQMDSDQLETNMQGYQRRKAHNLL